MVAITVNIKPIYQFLVWLSQLTFVPKPIPSSKHPNFIDSQDFIVRIGGCRVDADPVTIEVSWALDICLKGIHETELLMANIIVSQLITFTNTDFKVIQPVSCKIASMVTMGVSI